MGKKTQSGLGTRHLDRIADTTSHTGNWAKIQCVTATVFTTLTEQDCDTYGTLPTHPEGTWLFGAFTTIQLASGYVRAEEA